MGVLSCIFYTSDPGKTRLKYWNNKQRKHHYKILNSQKSELDNERLQRNFSAKDIATPWEIKI